MLKFRKLFHLAKQKADILNKNELSVSSIWFSLIASKMTSIKSGLFLYKVLHTNLS